MSKEKPGPDPDTLKIESPDWENAITRALEKTKPADGWPERVVKRRKPGPKAKRKAKRK